jgi:predicted TIM-barrel fold metal-dependent hydrolase
MHRPAQAAQELRRSVKELGLVGAILNDWQATEQFDGNGVLLFDTVDFDPFWEAVQELGCPVYFHPKVCFLGLPPVFFWGGFCGVRKRGVYIYSLSLAGDSPGEA